MMEYSELSERNFRRICLINWVLKVPALLIFAWPYYLMAKWTGVSLNIAFIGAFVFALPFMMTILHGHVTMALGALHRNHYYSWIERHPLTYGFFFHPVFFRTRFRMLILILSFMLLVLAWIAGF